MRKQLGKFIPLAIMLSMMMWGCAPTAQSPSGSAQAPGMEQKLDANTYAGKIVGRSNKAKTLSVEVGKEGQTKTMMVKFDDQTSGLEYATEGEGALVTWEMRDGERYATLIKPKIVKLPEGVAEIKTNEVKDLIDGKGNFLIIDSRPENRYAQSHLPGAICIPVDKMEAGAEGLLPKEKDKLLVFYCGGYT